MSALDNQIAAARDHLALVRGDKARRLARAELLRLLTIAVILRDKSSVCVYCKVETNASRGARGCTVDHIVPVSKGGRDELDNLVISCRSCNSRKGVRERWGRAAREVRV